MQASATTVRTIELVSSIGSRIARQIDDLAAVLGGLSVGDAEALRPAQIRLAAILAQRYTSLSGPDSDRDEAQRILDEALTCEDVTRGERQTIATVRSALATAASVRASESRVEVRLCHWLTGAGREVATALTGVPSGWRGGMGQADGKPSPTAQQFGEGRPLRRRLGGPPEELRWCANGGRGSGTIVLLSAILFGDSADMQRLPVSAGPATPVVNTIRPGCSGSCENETPTAILGRGRLPAGPWDASSERHRAHRRHRLRRPAAGVAVGPDRLSCLLTGGDRLDRERAGAHHHRLPRRVHDPQR